MAKKAEQKKTVYCVWQQFKPAADGGALSDCDRKRVG